MILIKNGKLYDFLKTMALIVLPAAGSAYFALAQIWGFGGSEEVNGTILVVDTFLGALLGLSSSAYKKTDAGIDGYVPSEAWDPALEHKDTITLKKGTPVVDVEPVEEPPHK